MDAETVQQPLPYHTVLYQSLPHQEHKTSKREQRAGWEKETARRKAGSMKGAQHKDPQEQGHQLRCCMCMAGKQPCKSWTRKKSMNMENAFFGLWQCLEDREAWSTVVFLGIKWQESKRSWTSDRGNLGSKRPSTEERSQHGWADTNENLSLQFK